LLHHRTYPSVSALSPIALSARLTRPSPWTHCHSGNPRHQEGGNEFACRCTRTQIRTVGAPWVRQWRFPISGLLVNGPAAPDAGLTGVEGSGPGRFRRKLDTDRVRRRWLSSSPRQRMRIRQWFALACAQCRAFSAWRGQSDALDRAVRWGSSFQSPWSSGSGARPSLRWSGTIAAIPSRNLRSPRPCSEKMQEPERKVGESLRRQRAWRGAVIGPC
jgi:hypothetical protein